MLPFLSMLVLATLLQSGASMEIQEIELTGGRGEYLEVGTDANYILKCNFRTPYDDPVTMVRWLRFGIPVYTWKLHSFPSVHPLLLGHVNTQPLLDPHQLHFTHIAYSLEGNYTCEVTTSAKVATAAYTLQVLDTSSGPYVCQVHVLSGLSNSTNTTSKNDAYQVDGRTDDIQVEFGSAACTLVWSMSTPPVFPRPNITCGYYSFDHDDVVHNLPAGLTLHKFPNQSWQASFQDTHIQVKDIPKNHRLGCIVRIPNTSFKQVVRAEDDFLVDNLIDAGGCPNLESEEGLGLSVDMQSATFTCRGDTLPADRSGRAIANIRCPEGHSAVFQGGAVGGWDWKMSLTCAENDIGWRTIPENTEPHGKLFDPKDLPYCMPGTISGSGRQTYLSVSWMTSLLLLLLH
ncbi:hypothetical protein Pcinc_005599 [Petrolisthes cinctipes]|uniref:Ig-like domain-containing protein n=1 Tax=Petrolisthes cinctipes TaxID=88211 RepID=A0AAE1GD51_PETCI|nr:hypothetical protein Pcinc_005599 [Petrolisthes cinctipes]